MNVSTIATTLANRTRHTLLCRVMDGSATREDIATLRAITAEASRNTQGAARYDHIATNRLAQALTSARYTNGQWRHVDEVQIRAARTFAGV